MTRDTSKAQRRPKRRGGHTRRATGAGRLASRVRVSCIALCCALVLQPSLLIPGRVSARTAAGVRPAAGPKSSLATITSSSLLAVVTAIAAGIRPLLPTHAAVARASVEPAGAYEPEPAAAVVLLGVPANLSVDSISDAQVSLSWAAVPGAVGYRVERSPDVLNPFHLIAETAATGLQDAGVSRGHTYLYRVRAVDAAGTLSPPSAVVMATAITFVDGELVGANGPLGRPATAVKADHVNDLRLAVDGVRRAAGLSARRLAGDRLRRVAVARQG
jgi:hypothetical protein